MNKYQPCIPIYFVQHSFEPLKSFIYNSRRAKEQGFILVQTGVSEEELKKLEVDDVVYSIVMFESIDENSQMESLSNL